MTEMAEMALSGEEGAGTGEQLAPNSACPGIGRQENFSPHLENVLDVV